MATTTALVEFEVVDEDGSEVSALIASQAAALAAANHIYLWQTAVMIEGHGWVMVRTTTVEE